MPASDRSPSETIRSRRAFLAGAGSVLVLGSVGRASATSEQVTPTMVIPAVDHFEDNYAGQFLTVRSWDSGKGGVQEATDGCNDLPWPADETIRNEGQLTDRRSDSPVAVRLPVFLDGRREPIREDALFVINQAAPCDGNYVKLQTASVRLHSVYGEPAGPTVSESDAEGTGFGLLAGAAGGGLALLSRALHGRE